MFYDGFISDTDDLELEIGLARLEDLMERRPLLLNSVLLRQNPHNVLEWHKRVKLYEGKPREVKISPDFKQHFQPILSSKTNC